MFFVAFEYNKLARNIMGGCLVVSITQKVIIYSMVGIMQWGLGTALVEASPNQQQYAQHDQGRQNQDRLEKQKKERHEREQRENHRHKQEMERHRGESDRDWHERQRRENERHDREMRWIILGILGIILDK